MYFVCVCCFNRSQCTWNTACTTANVLEHFSTGSMCVSGVATLRPEWEHGVDCCQLPFRDALCFPSSQICDDASAIGLTMDNGRSGLFTATWITADLGYSLLTTTSDVGYAVTRGKPPIWIIYCRTN